MKTVDCNDILIKLIEIILIWRAFSCSDSFFLVYQFFIFRIAFFRSDSFECVERILGTPRANNASSELRDSSRLLACRIEAYTFRAPKPRNCIGTRRFCLPFVRCPSSSRLLCFSLFLFTSWQTGFHVYTRVRIRRDGEMTSAICDIHKFAEFRDMRYKQVTYSLVELREWCTVFAYFIFALFVYLKNICEL